MNGTELLEDRIKALEGKVKKYTAIATVAGLLLGGGGVLGVAQWAYKAPLDKQVLKYESAMKSLDAAIQAASDSGAIEETRELRMELIGLDRNYRTALGLIEECMKILSESKAHQQDSLTRSWLKDTSRKLHQLQSQRKPVSEHDANESENR